MVSVSYPDQSALLTLGNGNDPFRSWWEVEPQRRLLVRKILHPREEMLQFGTIGNAQGLRTRDTRDELEINVVGDGCKQTVDE